MLGTIGIVERIWSEKDLKTDEGEPAFGLYRRSSHAIVFCRGYTQERVRSFMSRSRDGRYSTKSEYHPYRHEIGHAIWEYYKEYDDKFLERASKTYRECLLYSHKKKERLSEYAERNASEMFAEAIAEVMEGSPRKLAVTILKKMIGESYDDLFPSDG